MTLFGYRFYAKFGVYTYNVRKRLHIKKAASGGYIITFHLLGKRLELGLYIK